MARKRKQHHTTPWTTVVVIAILAMVSTIVLLSGKASVNTGDIMIAVILANMPGLLSAVYSERASRDVRRIEQELEEGNGNGR